MSLVVLLSCLTFPTIIYTKKLCQSTYQYGAVGLDPNIDLFLSI